MPELDFVPHSGFPLGNRESGATGEQKLDMRCLRHTAYPPTAVRD